MVALLDRHHWITEELNSLNHFIRRATPRLQFPLSVTLLSTFRQLILAEPYNASGYAGLRNFPFTFSSPPPTPSSESFFQPGQYHERPVPYPPPQHARYPPQPIYYHNPTTQWPANPHLPPITNTQLPPISEMHSYTPTTHRYPDHRDHQENSTGNHWHQNQY